MVIGAGIAGLVTADELVRAGHEVLVLEAQPRVGGRILTVREPFREGLYVEAGATHVVGDPGLLAVLEGAGVEVAPRAPRGRGLARVRLAHGQRSRVEPGQNDPPPAGLTPEELALGEEGRRHRYLGGPDGTDPLELLDPQLLRFDAMSVLEMLRERGASPAWIASFADAGYGEGLDTVSAAFVLRDMASIQREIRLGGGGRIAGGADRLPRALAARLGARLLTGAVVRRIERDASSARVLFERRGVAETMTADRVVCAVPHTALRRVVFAPGLSPLKERALREVPTTSVTRIWAQMETRLWTLRGERGDADTDLELGRLRDETVREDARSGILGSYLSGEVARRLGRRSAAEQVRALVAHAERVHPGAAGAFVTGAAKCWDDDPWARGAYAWFRPGQLRELGPALGAAEGVLHFAGDHTSFRPGFMHGAVASARRVVSEVKRALALAPLG